MARARSAVKVTVGGGPLSYTPAMNPEDQEDMLVSLAVKLAIKRLSDGTASNQLVSEIIKFGTQKEKLAREKLERENELLKAKTESIKAMEENKKLYADAIRAFGLYSGHPVDEEDEYEDY